MRTEMTIASHPRFEAERWILAPNGKSAIVRLARYLFDLSTLENGDVLVDGCLYRCVRADVPAHAPPYRTGEYITLLVEAPADR
jgi:hypothetical protein